MKAKVNIDSASGEIRVIPSKSVAHRFLICAALADEPTEIICPAESKDIKATVRCLEELGACVEENGGIYAVTPIKEKKNSAELFCGESGSTLRFLIPVAAALGGKTVFTGEGKLPERPCMPLVECMRKCGAKIEYSGALPLATNGGLCGGRFVIPGNISSQFITGLIFALPILPGDSVIEITGKIESLPYIYITLEAVAKFGIEAEFCGNEIHIRGNQKYRSPKRIEVEGDWSNASFWACLGAISDDGITLRGVRRNSSQGDKKVIEILKRFGAEVEQGEDYVAVRKKTLAATEIDVSEIPDLVPPLAVVASVADGETRFINAERLRIKESDRIESTVAMLRNLGADADAENGEIHVYGKKMLCGGKVDSYNDHRIAMSAAIAAAACEKTVEIHDAEAVEKSYGDFFEKLSSLGADVLKTEG